MRTSSRSTASIAGAMREGDRVRVGLLGAQQALLPQRRDHRLLGLGDGQAGEALTRLLAHAPVGPDNTDLIEAVLAADLEVVGVVSGRDLQGPGAELRVDVLV